MYRMGHLKLLFIIRRWSKKKKKSHTSHFINIIHVEIWNYTTYSTLYSTVYGYLCFWHLQTFEDSRRVNYTESVGRTETITRRLVKKYNFPSNFVCCYFGGRLFIKTFNGMNLFKSRASLEYLRVPLIFINLIRADRSWHILYKHSFSYNPSVISNSLFSIQYLSIQFKIFPRIFLFNKNIQIDLNYR